MKRSGRVAACWLGAALLAASGSAHADLDLGLYADLLQHYTALVPDPAGTRVDYAGLAAEPRWRALLRGLESARPQHLTTSAAKIAFWVNAYNILVIDTVLRHYPVESIRDAGSLLRPVWGRQAGTIGERAVTLGEIEHGILRPLGEPRIHSAIVCASTSCPSLARRPYEAARIDEQLSASLRRFLANPDKGLSIDEAQGRITLSKIFDWFAEDFEQEGGVLGYLTPYVPSVQREWFQRNARSARLDYFDYDWTLNDVQSRATGPR